MKHTVGIELDASLELIVWGFCPLAEEERLQGVACSELARVDDLPPEPLPRPYLHGNRWVIPCHNCSGNGRIMSSVGYPREMRCPVCAGSGHGQEVSGLHPWFRWDKLPREKPTGLCIVEQNPRSFTRWGGRLIAERLKSGKINLMIDFDLERELAPEPYVPEEYDVANEWTEPTESEWLAIMEREGNDLDMG